ncbi:MAG: hypothetical protein JXA64_10450 [Candidatus Fermentibacteraceae bacterium]|nr:hypothetical protein [Candidatus Fermentibacteraceae bacterium]MBN2609522.1 hypothetical protein [Candidatus Fermentibacteraceae bacterium]
MKISGWEVRVLFILVLGLLGTFAFEGFSPSPWYGLTGLGIGVMAVILQMAFVKIPADELIYATVGAVVGLVAGVLILLALKLANLPASGSGVTPLVMVPFALSYVFAHVAFTKGKKLGLMDGAEKNETASATPLLVDISAMVDGRVADMVIAGLIRGPFILSQSLKTRLEDMIDSEDIIERGRGRRGMETLERLEEAAGNSGGIQLRDFGKPDRERFRMLEFLRKERASLISSDDDLLDIAIKEGNHVINLDEVGPAARPVILPGEIVSLRLLRKGRNAKQAVGFTEDGTMIVVEESEEMIGSTVDVEAHTTFRSSGGTMVFARLRKEGNGNGS